MTEAPGGTNPFYGFVLGALGLILTRWKLLTRAKKEIRTEGEGIEAIRALPAGMGVLIAGWQQQIAGYQSQIAGYQKELADFKTEMFNQGLRHAQYVKESDARYDALEDVHHRTRLELSCAQTEIGQLRARIEDLQAHIAQMEKKA